MLSKWELATRSPHPFDGKSRVARSSFRVMVPAFIFVGQKWMWLSYRHDEKWWGGRLFRKVLKRRNKPKKLPIISSSAVTFSATTVISLVLLFVLCAAGTSRATTLIYKDFDTLVSEASGVVEGSVSDLQSVASGRTIYTFVTLSDLKQHKGRYAQPSFTLMQRGGRVGRRGHRIAGAPSFAKGERVIAFVSGNGWAWVPFVGWEQGVSRPPSRARASASSPMTLEPSARHRGRDHRQGEARPIASGHRAAGGARRWQPPIRRVESLAPGPRVEGGDIVVSDAGPAQADPPPMRYEAFVDAIRQRVARIGPSRAAANAEPLVSATPSNVPRGSRLQPELLLEAGGSSAGERN